MIVIAEKFGIQLQLNMVLAALTSLTIKSLIFLTMLC